MHTCIYVCIYVREKLKKNVFPQTYTQLHLYAWYVHVYARGNVYLGINAYEINLHVHVHICYHIHIYTCTYK